MYNFVFLFFFLKHLVFVTCHICLKSTCRILGGGVWVRGAGKGKGRLPSSTAPVKINCIASIAGYRSEETAASQLAVFLIMVTATLVLVPQMNNLNEQTLSVWLIFALLLPVG